MVCGGTHSKIWGGLMYHVIEHRIIFEANSKKKVQEALDKFENEEPDINYTIEKADWIEQFVKNILFNARKQGTFKKKHRIFVIIILKVVLMVFSETGQKINETIYDFLSQLEIGHYNNWELQDLADNLTTKLDECLKKESLILVLCWSY